MAGMSPQLKRQVLTVGAMYVGYAFFMVLKTAPITASVSMIEDGLIDKKQWGQILSIGTVGAILGKFITGWMADKFGGKFTFTLALAVTAIAIALFSAASSAVLFGAAFFLALLAKSAGWPSMAKLIDHWFQPDKYGRVWGVLSTSSRVGTIIATFVLGALLAYMSWRSVLLAAAGVGGLVVLYCLFRLKEHPLPEPEKIGDNKSVAAEETNDTPHPFDGTTLAQALKCFLVSSRFWLITGSMMGLTILWDFLNFVPIYLRETLEISESEAAMATSAFPAGSFVSVLVGGYVFDRLDRGKMAVVMGILLTIATGCILSFQFMQGWGLEKGTPFMPELGLAKDSPFYLSLALLFVFGLCVSPCYYLPMSVFSIEYGGIHAGFLIALLDALGFAAFAVFAPIAGALAEDSWASFFALLVAISVTSILTTTLFLRGESKIQRSIAGASS